MHGNECFLCLPLCMSVRLSVRLTCAVLHFAFAIKKKGGGETYRGPPVGARGRGGRPRCAGCGEGEAGGCGVW